jgi:glycine betaine/proline transport system substrate-binding protein
MKKPGFKKVITVISLVVISALCFTACSGSNSQPSQANSDAGGDSKAKPKIIFAEPDWDSVKFHNSVARFILEKGYGYETDSIAGSTPITFQALQKGDINAYMEVWSDNIATYDEALESGTILELSTNFDDNFQGLYVPTYIIEGDPARGIEPLAPDLKHVKDLPKYKDIFTDPEDPSKGIIYGSISGWAADEFLYKKYLAYELDKTYSYMRPGSEAALGASITSAYEKGLPWVGYYWEPTWIMGKYDMTLLQDEPYTDEGWEKGTCEFPSVDVTVCVNKALVESAPDVVEFLSHYKTSSAITSEALAYMMDNEADHDATAQWFLKEYKDLWTVWVTADAAEKVNAALD